MEVDLSEAANRLDIARVNYSSQMLLFKEVMGLDLADSIIIESKLDYTNVLVDVEKAVALAIENRNELKEHQIRIELSEMEIRRRKAALTLSIPLIDWGENRARVNAARANLEQNMLQLKGERISIEREIRTLVEQLQSSLNRLKLLLSDLMRKSFFDFDNDHPLGIPQM